MNDNSLLDPLQLYKDELKDKMHENAEKYFSSLVSKSGVDVNKNIETNDTILLKTQEEADAAKILRNIRSKKGFLIFLSVVLFIVALVFPFAQPIDDMLAVNILIGIAGLGLGIFILVHIKKKIKPQLKESSDLVRSIQEEINNLIAEAKAQLSALNSLYDYNMANIVVKETTPLLNLDENFDVKRFSMLRDRYGFSENNDKDSSVVLVQSGEILGNPFVLYRIMYMYMGNQTYTGSITIHWTTTERASDGSLKTVHHSEVLTASVTKPKPFYSKYTTMVYGNDAAPNLKFFREPQEASNYSDQELDKYLKKFDKKLDKMVKNDIDPSDGSQFTRLSNTKFEALFHALDRNNEVEFRLLFTPLAQTSMVKLLRSNDIIGDDFIFQKINKINVVRTTHSQGFDYCINPDYFVDYDIRKSKERFIDYLDTYFKNVYFDLAPLITIPLYQQQKPVEYIYGDDYVSNVTGYEHEVIANSFDSDYFMPKKCDTNIILKTHVTSKDGKFDRVVVNSYGFEAVKHIEYISKYGGDGRFHNVPVEYYTYEPVSKKTNMNVTNASVENSREVSYNFNDKVVVKRGILSYLGNCNTELENKINEIIQRIKKED